jgi:DNA/RNA-binding domain of Phe-tRNA-synthetase-like protein
MITPLKINPFHISISPEIFHRFPTAKVSFALIEVIVKSKLKGDEYKFLSDYKQEVVKTTTKRGITLENYVDTRVCISWRKIYQTFNTSFETKSTIECLLKRATEESEKIKNNKKANLGNISNFVDLYNCVAIEATTSMGALDLSKVEGDITLRYGKTGETFIPLGKEIKEHQVSEDQVIYADNKSVLTWLWNYRDAQHCCVPKDSPNGQPSYILLFSEQAEQDEGASQVPIWERPGDSEEAINLLKSHLTKINGRCILSDTLYKEKPSVVIDLSSLGF